MADKPAEVEVESPDLISEYRSAFQRIFPGVMADGVIDAARLAELLDMPVSQVDDPRERYGLMWAGKQDSVRSLLSRTRGRLDPDLPKSHDFDNARNVFIEGDNLEVLKLLQKAYNDRVKLIYIDPPYNTGSNAFIYPDNFSDTLRAYLEFTGQLDDEGNRKSANTDTLGRKHSRWLSMMYPRLLLARNLLTQDGVIFVSIGDDEVANLREVMDEIFGPENFIATVVWQKVYSPMSAATQFASVHDYIHIYARNSREWRPNLLPRTDKQDGAYKNPDNDPRGPWKPADATAQAGNGTPTQFYELETPTGRRLSPPPGRCWVYTKPRYEEMVAAGRVWFGKNGTAKPAIKRFLSEVKQGLVAQTFWPYDEVGHNEEAKKELLKRVKFGSQESVFNTPKPTRLIRRMLELATNADTGDIVLDFFAGSGSTADAVLQQNAADNGNRRFIAVQLPEKTGYDDFETVSAITLKRIESAMEAVGDTTGGLRTLRLAESNFRNGTPDDGSLFDLSETTIKSDDVCWDSIAMELLLNEGVPADEPWSRHQLDDAEVIIARGVAVVLTTELELATVKDALALNPRVIVFLEDSFGAVAIKAKALASAKSLGIAMKTA